MRLRNRILKIEKVLPDKKKDCEITELELAIDCLVENSEEFMECVRQLFHIQCKAGQSAESWEQWKEPYREQASVYKIRIHELIEQHKGNIEHSIFTDRRDRCFS